VLPLAEEAAAVALPELVAEVASAGLEVMGYAEPRGLISNSSD